ncbi:MAG: hypothetical protein KF722_08225 [Nitrospira sp.]|nr:hypothetical protein [Nitrospira sp.]
MLLRRPGFWILIALLVLLQKPVDAEWIAMDQRYQSPGLQTVYVDHDTIRREGNLVTLSALIDWKWMQGNRSPTRFYSTKLTKQFNCGENQVRTLATTDFYGHMGTGQVIGGGGHTSESHWISIESGTLNQGLWEAACGKG